MNEKEVWKAKLKEGHGFVEYRRKVIAMTSLTRKFFKSLVDGLEKDSSCFESVSDVANLKIK